MPPMITIIPMKCLKVWWSLFWLSLGLMLYTTVMRKYKLSLRDITLQMASISRQTKGRKDHRGHAYGNSFSECLNVVILISFLVYRHIYVVDLFDHSVHVLERKEDNALASLKVNNFQ